MRVLRFVVMTPAHLTRLFAVAAFWFGYTLAAAADNWDTTTGALWRPWCRRRGHVWSGPYFGAHVCALCAEVEKVERTTP